MSRNTRGRNDFFETEGMNVEELMKRINENKILGYKLFGIPAYIFVFILAVTEAANLLGVVPQSMTGSIGVMFVIGVVLGEIGDRLPIWKDYLGGGTLLALLGSSVMVYFGLLSESTVTSISELMQTTDFITFFSAVLICGSILSIDRKILLKSFLGYIPIVLAGVLVAAALGFLGGLAFGKSHGGDPPLLFPPHLRRRHRGRRGYPCPRCTKPRGWDPLPNSSPGRCPLSPWGWCFHHRGGPYQQAGADVPQPQRRRQALPE